MSVEVDIGVESSTVVYLTRFDDNGIPTAYEIYSPGAGGSIEIPVGHYDHPEITLLAIVRDILQQKSEHSQGGIKQLRALKHVFRASEILAFEANNP